MLILLMNSGFDWMEIPQNMIYYYLRRGCPCAGGGRQWKLPEGKVGSLKSATKQIIIIKIIDSMPKKFKKPQKTCQSHLFSLKPDPKQNTSGRTLNLTLSFCSRNAEAEADAQQEVRCIEAPVFNNDRSFASPAFTLPCDKSYYSQRRNKMLEQHELRYTYYTDEKTELNVPKPKSKNCYCSVCRQYYEDYLDHIQSPLHKSRIASSPFSRDIKELTRTFSNHRSLKNPLYQSKTTLDKSIIIEDISDNSDEVEIISNPYKKIKVNETNTAKESNNLQPPVPQTQQIEQPYYPFSAWHTYFKPPTFQSQSAVFPLNLSFNFTLNPFGFGPSLPLAQQVPGSGFQPFCVGGQNFNMCGFGSISGV